MAGGNIAVHLLVPRSPSSPVPTGQQVVSPFRLSRCGRMCAMRVIVVLDRHEPREKWNAGIRSRDRTREDTSSGIVIGRRLCVFTWTRKVQQSEVTARHGTPPHELFGIGLSPSLQKSRPVIATRPLPTENVQSRYQFQIRSRDRTRENTSDHCGDGAASRHCYNNDNTVWRPGSHDSSKAVRGYRP